MFILDGSQVAKAGDFICFRQRNSLQTELRQNPNIQNKGMIGPLKIFFIFLPKDLYRTLQHCLKMNNLLTHLSTRESLDLD